MIQIQNCKEITFSLKIWVASEFLSFGDKETLVTWGSFLFHSCTTFVPLLNASLVATPSLLETFFLANCTDLKSISPKASQLEYVFRTQWIGSGWSKFLDGSGNTKIIPESQTCHPQLQTVFFWQVNVYWILSLQYSSLKCVYKFE